MTDDQKNKERLKKALDSMIFLPHLKDRQAQSVLSALLPNDKTPRATGRPWDRGDLFRRLKTFKASTWFAKPDAISPQECARRGWENSEVDEITCESCKAVVSCPIPTQLLPDEAHKTAERYAKQISEAHAVACPWRSAACSNSLLHFPHMPKSALALDFEERAATVRRLLCLPPLAPAAIDTLLTSNLAPAISHLLESGPVSTSASKNNAQQAQRTVSPPSLGSALSNSFGKGVATCDQDAYSRRLRAIALCGWALEILSAPGANQEPRDKSAGASSPSAPPPAPAPSAPCRVGPESAMLSCALCGAKAGLWAFFPECQPLPIEPPARRKAPTALAPLGKVSTARGNLPSPGVRSPTGGGNGAAVLTRNVSISLGTTIAGGAMAESSEGVAAASGGGPFGGAGASGSADLFGPPPLPRAAVQSINSTGDDVPVFGFAALRAAEPSSTSALLQQSAAKRRRDDAIWEAALAGPGEKRQKENASGGASGVPMPSAATAAASAPAAPMPVAPPMAPPSQATLQQCRSLRCEPLDPFMLHRSFCPWVHSGPQCTSAAAATAAEHAAPCGWQWCAQQLGPPAVQLRGDNGGPGAEDDQSEEDGGNSAAWDPSAMLRSTLAKVEVKKT